MSQREKLIQAILSGERDKSFQFFDLCLVLDWLGFDRRVRGDHFIFTKPGVEDIINLQSCGGRA